MRETEGNDPYDHLPYTEDAYAEAHPDRLAVVARLSGWAAPPVDSARVLEIGCGRGGNLLPLASALPNAALVGADRSLRQIDEARGRAAEGGLANVTFHATSFQDAPLDDPFEYVLCHGVASWVAPAVRRALFAKIAGALAPGGVAHVSFNVLPGWYERMAARDWLKSAARGGDAKDAAQSLAWLAKRVPAERVAYKGGLVAVGRRLGDAGEAYVAHEYLSEEHHPDLVSRVLDEAAVAGLTYLGDAIPHATALELLDDDVRARAAHLGPAAAQELVDFVTGAAFRRALFVRSDEAAARAWSWPHALNPAALASLRLASRLRPVAAAAPGDAVESFACGDEVVQIADGSARAALHELARAAPASLTFGNLAARAGDRGALAQELFDVWLATGALDLHDFAPACATAPSLRPRACPLARWHAANGGPITNVWHQRVVLPDPFVAAVLARADGTKTEVDLAALLGPPGTVSADARAAVEASLEILASLALLVA